MKKNLMYILVLFLLNITRIFSQWEPINNGLNGGVITYMGTINGVIWASGEGGGLYSSSDEGLSWQSGDKSLRNLQAYSLYEHENVLFALERFRVYHSTNKGSTWEENSIYSDKYSVQGFLSVGKILYAKVSDGLMFSADTGKTWKRKTLPENYTKLGAMAFIDTSIYITTGDYVYRTEDSCKTWVKLEGLLPVSVTKLIAYSDNIYACTAFGLHLSTNKGKTWIKSVQGLENSNSIYDIVKVGEKLFAAADGIYVSENKGKNWTKVFTTERNEPVYRLLLYNNKIFAGTNRRILCSTDMGVKWTERMEGFSCLQTVMLARHGSRLLVSTDYELYLTVNSGAKWNKVECNQNKLQIGNIALTNDMLYVSIGGFILFSSDDGKKWDTIKYEKPINPKNGMVAFEDKLYVSHNDYLNVTSDRGSTWRKIEKFSGYELSSISVSQGKMYVGDIGGYVFSRLNDSTWVRSEAIPDQGADDVSSVASTEKTMYAIHRVVYRKKSTSPIWEVVYDGMPLYSPYWLYAEKNLCFVAQYVGVFVIRENEPKWSDMSTGLLNKVVKMIQSDDNYLYVCTNGSGVYRYPLVLAHANEGYNDMGTFSVYPNPNTNNENIHIRFSEASVADYSIVNQHGEKILEGKLHIEGGISTVEGTNILLSGIYGIIIRINNKETHQKFVICK